MSTATDLAKGRALRDAGMARAEAGDVDGHDKQVIDRAIARLGLRPEPWSANDLRFLCPNVRQPLIGARIRAAARRKEITHVGYTPSTLPSTHAHEIKTWVKAA